MRPLGRVLVKHAGFLIRRGDWDTDPQREDTVKHGKKAGIYTPRREALEETDPANTEFLTSSLQNSEKISFCYLNHPVCDTWLRQF